MPVLILYELIVSHLASLIRYAEGLLHLVMGLRYFIKQSRRFSVWWLIHWMLPSTGPLKHQ